MAGEFDNPVARDADPNGVNVSAAAIQASIDAGNDVWMPNGIFRIESTLTLKPGQVLRGAGRGDPSVSGENGTVLKSDGASPLLSVPSDADVSDLCIDANGAAVGCLVQSGAENPTFNGVRIKGASTSWSIPVAWNASWTLCDSEGAAVGWDCGDAANGLYSWLCCSARSLQTGGVAWKVLAAETARMRACRAVSVSDLTAIVVQVGGNVYQIDIFGHVYEASNCRILEFLSGAGPTTKATFHGGTIDTGSCTASTPSLFQLSGGSNLNLIGTLIQGAENYPDFVAGAGTLHMTTPVHRTSGGADANPRSINGMPVGAPAYIIWHGDFR